MDEARSKLKLKLKKSKESKGSIPMGALTSDSLDEDDKSMNSISKATNVDYYAGADEADPTLKLLRLNPYRWFKDQVESTYSLPHTEQEMEAINQYEERQRAAQTAKKERERLKWAEQEAILKQKREDLKRRTTYLWSKLRNHALVIGHLVKTGQMEVQHSSTTVDDESEGDRIRRALMARSDSSSTFSTVPEETKVARELLVKELEEQKSAMHDITTFETDENKIIVIQKKQPKKRGVAQAEGQALTESRRSNAEALLPIVGQRTKASSFSSSSSSSSPDSDCRADISRKFVFIMLL